MLHSVQRLGPFVTFRAAVKTTSSSEAFFWALRLGLSTRLWAAISDASRSDAHSSVLAQMQRSMWRPGIVSGFVLLCKLPLAQT